MNTQPIVRALRTILAEMLHGPTASGYLLNHNDVGILRSLDRLSAQAASATHGGGASIAAHVDHLRYGLSLMNRWSAGENPFAQADWSASWKKTSVSPAAWQELRTALRDEANRWLHALREPRDVTAAELNGIVGSIAHLAYHLGAIRQINRTARGPAEQG